MAATDQMYRSQRLLDIVFAVSGVLMLVRIVAMFAQDYNRDYKVEIRRFRDVEEGMANRAALRALPKADDITKAMDDVNKARADQKDRQGELKDLDKEIGSV